MAHCGVLQESSGKLGEQSWRLCQGVPEAGSLSDRLVQCHCWEGLGDRASILANVKVYTYKSPSSQGPGVGRGKKNKINYLDCKGRI